MAEAVETQGTVFAINSAGSGSPVWTTIKGIVSFSGFDGQAAEIDISDMESVAKEFLIGLPDNGSLSLDANWMPADAGQVALRTARTARTLESFKITWSDNTTTTFSGYVMQASRNGGVDAKVDTSFVIRISGAVTDA